MIKYITPNGVNSFLLYYNILILNNEYQFMKDKNFPKKSLLFPLKENKKFPKAFLFYTKTPLFQKLNLEKVHFKTVAEIFKYDDKLECFCPECKKDRIFLYRETIIFDSKNGTIKKLSTLSTGSKQIDGGLISEDMGGFDLRTGKQFYAHDDTDIIKIFYCSANENHPLNYYITIRENNLIKIGQYPTLYDISLPQIEKYRQLLSKNDYSGFNTSLRLFVNGSGIGSFVYLRRILENLIEKKHKKAKKNEDWDENKYLRCNSFNERVRMLKDLLPSTLTENVFIYRILNKGIHELNEKECLNYYSVIRDTIEMILEEEINEINFFQKKKKLQSDIQKISREIANENNKK